VLEDLLESKRIAEAGDEVRTIAGVVDDAYADVREAILGLRTKTNRLGLVSALQEYLRKFGLQTGIQTELRVQADGALEFAPNVETQLIRVVQEALANVRKHARAERAIVRLWAEAGQTCISIEDDGCGFDPSRKAASGHYGLATMRERVQDVDGSLEVRSASGTGTSIVVCVPTAGPRLDGTGGAVGPGSSLAGPGDQCIASAPSRQTTPAN
jgi:signal transduction histidine kinase